MGEYIYFEFPDGTLKFPLEILKDSIYIKDSLLDKHFNGGFKDTNSIFLQFSINVGKNLIPFIREGIYISTNEKEDKRLVKYLSMMNNKTCFYEIYMQMKHGIIDMYGDQNINLEKYSVKYNHYCKKSSEHNREIWNKYFKEYILEKYKDMNPITSKNLLYTLSQICTDEDIKFYNHNDDIYISTNYNKNVVSLEIKNINLIINKDFYYICHNKKQLLNSVFNYLRVNNTKCISMDDIITTLYVYSHTLINYDKLVINLVENINKKIFENKDKLM